MRAAVGQGLDRELVVQVALAVAQVALVVAQVALAVVPQLDEWKRLGCW